MLDSLKDFISHKGCYTSETVSLQNNNPINVVYSVDKNYLYGTIASMVSVLENSSDEHFVFHLFTDYLDNQYEELFQQISTSYSVTINFYKIDKEKAKFFPSIGQWPNSIFYRLIAIDHLQNELDSVLYLDADVICKGSLAIFNTFDFGTNGVAAVQDMYFTREDAARRFKEDEFNLHYFNSGVLFLNLSYWKEQLLTSKFLTYVEDKNNHPLLSCPDQDILNLLFLKKVIWLDKGYNTIYSIVANEFLNKGKEYYKTIITDNTRLIHYTDSVKPWFTYAQSFECNHYFAELYQKSKILQSHPLNDAIPLLVYKFQAKLSLKQGRLINSLKNYSIYRVKKLKKRFKM